MSGDVDGCEGEDGDEYEDEVVFMLTSADARIARVVTAGLKDSVEAGTASSSRRLADNRWCRGVGRHLRDGRWTVGRSSVLWYLSRVSQNEFDWQVP